MSRCQRVLTSLMRASISTDETKAVLFQLGLLILLLEPVLVRIQYGLISTTTDYVVSKASDAGAKESDFPRLGLSRACPH
jgi:hypothetical protein